MSNKDMPDKIWTTKAWGVGKQGSWFDRGFNDLDMCCYIRADRIEKLIEKYSEDIPAEYVLAHFYNLPLYKGFVKDLQELLKEQSE